MKTILSDGSAVVFNELTSEDFIEKTKGNTLENKIYKSLYDELSDTDIQQEIKKEFPKPEIHRRNTGYAVDILLQSDLFGGSQPINVGKLLVEARHACIYNRGYLALDDLPPTNNVMVVTHFNSIQESLEAVMIAMKHHLYTCEMIDDIF
jgi:hypothetical protein